MGLGVTILLVPPDALALGSRSEFARAVLSRSFTSSLPRGFPLVNSLDLAPSRPSHGVSFLSATFDSGSDLHRGYLPRLCCVLRLSQPLDAFFRPNHLDLVSCRCHPGLHLQRVSLRDSLTRLATRSVPPAVLRRHLSAPPLQLQGLLHSRSPYQTGRCYPDADGRSSPDVHPFEVFLSRSRPLAGAASHGLQHAAGPEPRPSPVVVLALQSFKEPRSRRPLSRPSPSVGFSVQVPL
jgi:hypothetical protein